MATLTQIREWYELPLTTLIFRAQAVHHQNHDPAGVQLCTLQSIKTGRCPENCAYCPQSAHYETGLADVPLMDADDIIVKAKQARAGGASRFCMGAAWREVRDGPQFDSVLRAVEGVAAEGLEVCCTLGMLTVPQAEKLKEAGCRVYNHNLDTSREYYPQIISTRCYDDRLKTLENVRAAGREVCCGGILGMGEGVEDRLKLIAEVSSLDPQPESVPINALVPVAGTPLAEQTPVDAFEFVRIIAVARLALPKAIVRLSAGRTEMSEEMQALCYLAGANSIFLGEKLLTTPNPDAGEDLQLLRRLGLHALDPEATRQLQAASREAVEAAR
jgi:biotin synthase